MRIKLNPKEKASARFYGLGRQVLAEWDVASDPMLEAMMIVEFHTVGDAEEFATMLNDLVTKKDVNYEDITASTDLTLALTRRIKLWGYHKK